MTGTFARWPGRTARIICTSRLILSLPSNCPLELFGLISKPVRALAAGMDKQPPPCPSGRRWFGFASSGGVTRHASPATTQKTIRMFRAVADGRRWSTEGF